MPPHDEHIVYVDVLCPKATDILHEHHYIRIVQVLLHVSPNCQLHTSVYLGDGDRDQASKII